MPQTLIAICKAERQQDLQFWKFKDKFSKQQSLTLYSSRSNNPV
jgi:hypothetical protein